MTRMNTHLSIINLNVKSFNSLKTKERLTEIGFKKRIYPFDAQKKQISLAKTNIITVKGIKTQHYK